MKVPMDPSRSPMEREARRRCADGSARIPKLAGPFSAYFLLFSFFSIDDPSNPFLGHLLLARGGHPWPILLPAFFASGCFRAARPIQSHPRPIELLLESAYAALLYFATSAAPPLQLLAPRVLVPVSSVLCVFCLSLVSGQLLNLQN